MRLSEFGRVEGFVTGSFNEGSADLHAHLALVARGMARGWRRFGARSFADCLGTVTTFLYRKWGAAIANANASLRVTRLESLGARGQAARSYGVAGDDGVGLGGVGALDDLHADLGGGFGPGFE